jgi:hypothetical protein
MGSAVRAGRGAVLVLTILVDDEPGTRLPPPADFKPTPIRDQLEHAIDPAADCVLRDGAPCLLYADWDYGEDWSGEFVREVHPYTLIGASVVTESQWRNAVRVTHGGPD